MVSLYVHIPFCQNKCNYCNFFIAPINGFAGFEDYKVKYLKSLDSEIKFWSKELINVYGNNELKTVYIGGGTPLSIGKQSMFDLIDNILKDFNVEYLEELTIELNPDPLNEVLSFIDDANKRYKNLFRLRYSIGIQSLDDEVLKLSNRGYTFNNIVLFLRSLVSLKNQNNVFNFDFISFGKFNKNKRGELMLWDDFRMNFFNDFVNSGFADSFSLYMMELFEGSPWNDLLVQNNAGIRQLSSVKGKQDGDSVTDNIYDEFNMLRSVIEGGGYQRYEISNFSFPSKQSIHNNVYWDMGDYIGVGMGASGKIQNTRYTNTKNWEKYFNLEYQDLDKKILLTENDILVEGFFLGMRRAIGVRLPDYSRILVNDHIQKIQDYEENGLMELYNDGARLTQEGMDVYNSIITELIDGTYL